jgi:DNA-binding HxlR family transcriptional regulator
MRWVDIGNTRCSVARALSVVGDRWTLLLLREAFLGTTRFEDFRDNTGASRHLVAERLGALVEHGVLERRPYQERPPRLEYVLTDKGRDLYPVIVGLLAWGDRWMRDEKGPSLVIQHGACGHAVTLELRCPACDEPLDATAARHTFPFGER